MEPSSFDPIASRQHGLATSKQLATLGWTEMQVRHAADRGRIERVRHGVWRAAGAPRTREQAWMAAVLAAPRSVLSHVTACALWTVLFMPPPDAIDLLREGTRPRLEGVAGHTTRSLPISHVGIRRAIPVTTPERSIIDCCALLTPKQLASAIADGRRRGIVRLPRLARVVDEVPVSGRRAIRPMIEYLSSRIAGYEVGDSDPEIDLVDLLVRAGFARPHQQVRVRDAGKNLFIDVGWPDIRVGFEYDSLEFHEQRFHEDRDRWRRLRRAGWDVWPITSTTTANEILAIASDAFGHEPVPEQRFAPGSEKGTAATSEAGSRRSPRARRGRGWAR